jgi:2-polyprenyl-3-methyl-5-hydroxy-6-metoxy-1,4-benzoquinol methylase
MTNDICGICGNDDHHNYYIVNERMLGTLDEFTYFQCQQCDCLQIKKIPDNLANYYPENYYSYKKLDRLIKSRLRSWVDTHRVNHLTNKKNIAGFLLNKISKPLEYIPWIQSTGVQSNAKILDIGCGQGRLLLRMALGGFTNLTGIDPFIKENISYHNGVKIIKASLEEFTNDKRRFDLIMLHHSLEHMPDQHGSLKAIAKLLAPNGTAIIRIPLSDSFAWQHYKEYWVQLDAPRHLYLHSKKSLALLAKENGLRIDKTVYDSAKFQFTGSELYLRDIPLNSDKKTRQIFSKEQLKEFDARSVELNNTEKGDQAVFYLKATDT